MIRGKLALVATLLSLGCTTRGVAGSTGESPFPTSLPPMTVHPIVTGTRVEVDVTPVEGARDYRIYALPDASDVDPVTGVIANAIYRCAGDREAPRVITDGEAQVASACVSTSTVGAPPELPFARTTASATLGWVWREPGPDRTPVYVLADGAPDGDTRVDCFFQRYAATRAKRYTTSSTERDALLASGWRDHGIAFYAPTTGRSIVRFTDRDVLATLDELATITPSPDVVPAFDVLAAQLEGSQPLMRVHYANICAREHDELAVGADAFAVALHQGGAPIPHVHWAGITARTTLVIEALDAGCPFQGHFAVVHRDAEPDHTFPRQAWLTLDELRAGSATGEVFLNGQHEPANRPRAIARTTIVVEPAADEALDWSRSFDVPITIPTPVDVITEGAAHYDFGDFDVHFSGISPSSHVIGQSLGELWITYADSESLTTSGARIVPRSPPVLQASAFVQLRMDVDAVSTDRRYTDLVFSDLPDAVDDFTAGWGIVVHPSGAWPSHYEVWICDHVAAEDGCTRRPLALRPDGVSWDPTEMGFAPTAPLGESAGVDRVSRVEVFASTQRVYVQVDGAPYGCVDLPAGLVPEGAATASIHDVLFVSSQDCESEVLGANVYAFHHDHMHYETRRHFDGLAMSSGRGAPAWDETRVPCWPADAPE